MEQIQNLLNQVYLIRKKNEEILDATGGRFNMFRACGVNHYENTHSAIIAEFLRPDGTHGLKAKLLRCFIDLFCNNALKNGFDCDNARVVTEHSAVEGRIDILVEDRKNHAIIIENKIYAGDQFEQLKRYNHFAETKYGKGNYQIFYLTLLGNEASNQSGEGVDYPCISYKTDIIIWLERCTSIAVRLPMVRETIIQYINCLKILTNQDMDSKNKEEIVEMIISNRNYLKSANDIYKIWDDCREGVLKKLIPSIESIAANLSLDYYIDEGFVHCKNGFWLKKQEWDYSILFWFYRDQMGVGIDDWNLRLGVKCSEDKTNKLRQFLKDYRIHKNLDLNWIWGTTFDAWDLCSWEDKENSLPSAIEEITKIILEKLSQFDDLS
ncbi:MAG: PD-(D/E)XK nuclease family protein [Oscillospiraceae bacterium]|jgi:hypothetical protein|nr:PD-(D/E)XK nuclease family protein [Oscillospiraceae bacterium]